MTVQLEKDSVLFQLALMHSKEKQKMAAIKRKRSWRDSEKAMATFDVIKNLSALDYAIECIKNK